MSITSSIDTSIIIIFVESILKGVKCPYLFTNSHPWSEQLQAVEAGIVNTATDWIDECGANVTLTQHVKGEQTR